VNFLSLGGECPGRPGAFGLEPRRVDARREARLDFGDAAKRGAGRAQVAIDQCLGDDRPVDFDRDEAEIDQQRGARRDDMPVVDLEMVARHGAGRVAHDLGRIVAAA